MGDMNPLKGFVPDTWYKVLLAMGAGVLFVSLFAPIQGLPNEPVQILSLGAFLLGLGAMKEHKSYTLVMDYGDLVDGRGPKMPRHLDLGALLLRLVGFGLIFDGASWLMGYRLSGYVAAWIQRLAGA